MLLEFLVFNGKQRIAQALGQIVVADQDAPLDGERADLAAFIVVEVSDRAGAVVSQLGDFRQIGGINDEQPGKRAHQRRRHHQRAEQHAAHHLSSRDLECGKLFVQIFHAGPRL